MHTLYQHIQVFGRPGHFIVRLDNDATTEREFERYDSALLFLIAFLGQSRQEEGRKLNDTSTELNRTAPRSEGRTV